MRERERDDEFHLLAVAAYLRTGNRRTPKNIHVILCLFWDERKQQMYSFHEKSKGKRQKSGYSLLCHPHCFYRRSFFFFYFPPHLYNISPSLSFSLSFLSTLAHFVLHLPTPFRQFFFFFCFFPLTLDMLNYLTVLHFSFLLLGFL